MTAQAARRISRGSGAVAGDGLLHPVALASIAILLVNDHLLKGAWPGLVTGKVSDFAGLLYFPLFLQAVAEVAQRGVGRWRAPSLFVLFASIALTALLFTSMKFDAGANAAVASALGALQAVTGGVIGAAPSVARPVAIALDPTDLVALIVLPITYKIGARRLAEADDRGATDA